MCFPQQLAPACVSAPAELADAWAYTRAELFQRGAVDGDVGEGGGAYPCRFFAAWRRFFLSHFCAADPGADFFQHCGRFFS